MPLGQNEGGVTRAEQSVSKEVGRSIISVKLDPVFEVIEWWVPRFYMAQKRCPTRKNNPCEIRKKTH